MRIPRRGTVATAVLAAFLFLFAGRALAATETWDGGCGPDASWSCANNWSGDIVPGAEDRVIFDSTSTANSTVDPSFAGEVTRMDINSGYTGTVTLAEPLAVSSLFTQSAGAFTAAGQELTLGALTLSGGSFTASSGTTSVSKNLTISGSPTFNANNGTLNFNGKTATLACDGQAFHLVTFTHANGSKTVGSDCTLPLGSNPTISGEAAALSMNGTLSGSGVLTIAESAGRLTIGSTGALSGFSGLALKSLAVNGATANFGSYKSFAIGKAFIQTGGTVTVPAKAAFQGPFEVNAGSTFNAPSGTISFENRFNLDSASTFNANEGTVNFTGTQGGGITCGNQTFHRVTFTHSGNNRLVASDCTLPLGYSPVIGSGAYGGISLSGTLTGTGTLKTATGASLILNEGYGLEGFEKLQPSGLSINSGTADLSAYTAVTASEALLVKAGATLVAPVRLNILGDMTVEPEGTFEPGLGQVVLNGSEQTISGDITFNDLIKHATTEDTLTFSAGDTQTINGSLSLNGKSTELLLNLVSSVPGTPWLVDAKGTTSVRYASVADSTSIGPVIPAHNSVDAGGNTGWTF